MSYVCSPQVADKNFAKMSTRQIKFRAWDATHKKMHHKVLIGNTFDKENYTANSIYIMPSDVDYEIPKSGQWMHFDENSNIHIMQFSGLFDKAGIEIYEGDIVNVPYVTPDSVITDTVDYIATVVFKSGSFCITGHEQGTFVLLSNWCIPTGVNYISNYGEVIQLSEITHLSVVANVYQNKDLSLILP